MKNVDSGEKKTQPKLGQFFVKTEAQSHDVWTVKEPQKQRLLQLC